MSEIKAKYKVTCIKSMYMTSGFIHAIFEINEVKKEALVWCVRLPIDQRDSAGICGTPGIVWRLKFTDKTIRQQPDYRIIRDTCLKKLREFWAKEGCSC